MYINNIIPEKDLKKQLLAVQTPGRYVGGEYGIIVRSDAQFRMALCFPDLYEIGMSNLAVRILYREINKLEGVACERVFTPAPDFESELKQNNIPLYTLETGTPLNQCDLIGFSIGYELSATNVLTVLESGGVPLRGKDRCENDPLVIAGGPAITNPMPFHNFLDAVWIGEAEEGFIYLLKELAELKKRGASRNDLLSALEIHPHVWVPGKSSKVTRCIFDDFTDPGKFTSGFLVPNISTVQDNGIVEIMRGCPSGCRFCHAGYFYRPFRQKSLSYIQAEVESLIYDYGYREITLSSLSTGDYNGIENLIRSLNSRYSAQHISFSFPSLRVNSITLPLLDELSRVRKSGLTFAVETPSGNLQKGLNKEVPMENLVEILLEARNMGWQLAKFYFMIGLPFSDQNEGMEIALYLNEVQQRTKMKINANIGTFIPKPHTPFQWAGQIGEEESQRRLQEIKQNVSRGIKVGYHAPFNSMLEGLVSRGDIWTGDLILEAWKNGARLDAWDDFIRRDIWRDVLEKGPQDKIKEIFKKKETSDSLPWDTIDMGVSKKFLAREFNLAQEEKLTNICDLTCDHNCGICTGGIKPEKAIINSISLEPDSFSKVVQNNIQSISGSAVLGSEKKRLLFEFSKEGKGIYYSHINVMQIFERALLRADIPISFTEGFNPKPRLEFAHPLALGQDSCCEIAAVDIPGDYDCVLFIEKINLRLPQGIKVLNASLISDSRLNKRQSLMGIFGGSRLRVDFCENGLEIFYQFKEKLSLKGINLYMDENKALPGSNSSCIVEIFQKGKESSPGIKKILKDAGVEQFTDSIIRLKLYAKKADTYLHYFDYFKEL